MYTVLANHMVGGGWEGLMQDLLHVDAAAVNIFPLVHTKTVVSGSYPLCSRLSRPVEEKQVTDMLVVFGY